MHANELLWRGAISFGLIYVPVDVVSASQDGSLSLHFLDSRDFSPVGYQRINKSTGKEVDWAHIVKGYEYEKGHYVALSEADFKHANVKASETIEIANFTDTDKLRRCISRRPYYLSPQKGGQKVYSLLRQALQSTKKAAVGTFVMRGRQHLCVIVPNGEVLMLITLRFANEVLTPALVEASRSTPAKTKKRLPPKWPWRASWSSKCRVPSGPSIQGHLSRRPHAAHSGEDTHETNSCARRGVRDRGATQGPGHRLDGGAAASLRKKGAQARAAPRKSSKAGKRA